MSEEKKRRIVVDENGMINPCFPPYYPDEDRQLAAELMALAGKLMDIASRVIKPDHYWYRGESPPSPPPIVPMDSDT